VKEAGLTGGCPKAQGNLLYTVASKVCVDKGREGWRGEVGCGEGSGADRGLPKGAGQPAVHCGQQGVGVWGESFLVA
jgi:hypothetical protein